MNLYQQSAKLFKRASQHAIISLLEQILQTSDLDNPRFDLFIHLMSQLLKKDPEDFLLSILKANRQKVINIFHELNQRGVWEWVEGFEKQDHYSLTMKDSEFFRYVISQLQKIINYQ